MNDADAMKLFPMIYELMHKFDWLGPDGPDAGHRADIREALSRTYPPYAWDFDLDTFGTIVYRDSVIVGLHTTDELFDLIPDDM